MRASLAVFSKSAATSSCMEGDCINFIHMLDLAENFIPNNCINAKAVRSNLLWDNLSSFWLLEQWILQFSWHTTAAICHFTVLPFTKCWKIWSYTIAKNYIVIVILDFLWDRYTPNPVHDGTRSPPRTTWVAHRPVLKIAQLARELRLKSILLLFFFNPTCIFIDLKMTIS